MQIRDPSIRTTIMRARNKVFDIVETDGLNRLLRILAGFGSFMFHLLFDWALCV